MTKVFKTLILKIKCQHVEFNHTRQSIYLGFTIYSARFRRSYRRFLLPKLPFATRNGGTGCVTGFQRYLLTEKKKLNSGWMKVWMKENIKHLLLTKHFYLYRHTGISTDSPLSNFSLVCFSLFLFPYLSLFFLVTLISILLPHHSSPSTTVLYLLQYSKAVCSSSSPPP